MFPLEMNFRHQSGGHVRPAKKSVLDLYQNRGHSSECVLADSQDLVKSTVLLRKIRKRPFRLALALQTVVLLPADARVLKVKGCFAPLAAHADGRDGLLRLTAVVRLKARFCCAKSAKGRFASRLLCKMWFYCRLPPGFLKSKAVSPRLLRKLMGEMGCYG